MDVVIKTRVCEQGARQVAASQADCVNHRSHKHASGIRVSMLMTNVKSEATEALELSPHSSSIAYHSKVRGGGPLSRARGRVDGRSPCICLSLLWRASWNMRVTHSKLCKGLLCLFHSRLFLAALGNRCTKLDGVTVRPRREATDTMTLYPHTSRP